MLAVVPIWEVEEGVVDREEAKSEEGKKVQEEGKQEEEGKEKELLLVADGLPFLRSC